MDGSVLKKRAGMLSSCAYNKSAAHAVWLVRRADEIMRKRGAAA